MTPADALAILRAAEPDASYTLEDAARLLETIGPAARAEGRSVARARLAQRREQPAEKRRPRRRAA